LLTTVHAHRLLSTHSYLTRYRDLVDNLHLSEEDVSLLLAEGPEWPPIRGEMRGSSLIDLLWLVQDEQAGANDETKKSQARIASLEQKVVRERRRREAAEAVRANAVPNGIRTPPRSRSSSRSGSNGDLVKERDRLKDELESVRREERDSERLEEENLQLKARLTAFEASAGAFPSRLSPFPSSISALRPFPLWLYLLLSLGPLPLPSIPRLHHLFASFVSNACELN
jgi:hypothetical protein